MTDHKLDLSKAPWVGRRPDNQFCGYYISFGPTGCGPVDEILKAVAMAAKGYHHTEGWGESFEGAPTYLEWIQAAAESAAAQFGTNKDQETTCPHCHRSLRSDSEQ